VSDTHIDAFSRLVVWAIEIRATSRQNKQMSFAWKLRSYLRLTDPS
jgi:hypothetical protein